MARRKDEADEQADTDELPLMVGVRLTRREREALEQMVEAHKAEVAGIGHDPSRVGASTVLRVLLRKEATRLGLLARGYKPRKAGRPKGSKAKGNRP